MQLMKSIREFLGFPKSDTPCVTPSPVDRMLADLQRMCTTLPDGQAEVFLSNGCVNVHLSWTPEGPEKGKETNRPETGIVFQLNGRSNQAFFQEVMTEEVTTEEIPVPQATVPEATDPTETKTVETETKGTGTTETRTEETETDGVRLLKDNTEGSAELPECQDLKELKELKALKEAEETLQMRTEEAKETETEGTQEALSAESTANKEEKPSKSLQSLHRLRDFLHQHYAFRYNRLTDCTECAVLPATSGESGQAPYTLQYQAVDTRLLNTLSLAALNHGVECWDRDVKRMVESTDMPAFHPFLHYMNHLPVWDGRDRLTELAQRVSDDAAWVRHFCRWMLAVAAQWMNGAEFGRRANSVAPLLVSARQGLGKSTFCRQLMPTALQTYFTESFDLKNPTTAEHKLTAFGLINIDEFDRLSADRMPLLKNLMQMERITLRRAYKHSAEPLPRIANFIATSNRYDLLTDLTGSRRFICVDVQHPIDCVTPIEYDQLYAQLKEAILAGERTWFDKEEEAEIQARNQAFYRVLPAQELLEETVEFCESGAEGAVLLSAANLYSRLQKQYPAALRDCSPRAFSRLLRQRATRVHTQYGNGYWVRLK